jgi:Uncharacterised nucleotidyltransferase
MGKDDPNLPQLEASLKKTAAALKDADVPFLLGGSLAAWVRGGPEIPNDLDLMVHHADVDRALDALEAAGMRPERPPEDWLVKAWDGPVLVDLIFHPIGLKIEEGVMERAEEMNVFSITMPVMRLEDVITTKLHVLNEHYLDFAPLLQISRGVREQVRWAEVAARTHDSPYARAFFALLRELSIIEPAEIAAGRQGSQVTVVS